MEWNRKGRKAKNRTDAERTVKDGQDNTNFARRNFDMALKLKDIDTVTMRDKRKARDELSRIRQANDDKLLVAREVVEAASEDASPLHGYFEWDDSKAAHQHRLAQARHLITTIKVTFPDDKEENAVPKFVSLAADRKRKDGGYRETSQVINNKELLKELEVTAKRDVDAILRRYEMLKEFVANVRKAAGIG
jgi:hypothetical protein